MHGEYYEAFDIRNEIFQPQNLNKKVIRCRSENILDGIPKLNCGESTGSSIFEATYLCDSLDR